MNYSRQRQIILDTLKENVVHPTAEYLYDVMKEKYPSISLSTLYRNLNQLAEKGLIKKIDGLEVSSHFDHNIHEHYHFICEKCKKVFDIPVGIAPDVVANAEKETGFVVNKHDIVLHGICNECLKIFAVEEHRCVRNIRRKNGKIHLYSM